MLRRLADRKWLSVALILLVPGSFEMLALMWIFRQMQTAFALK